MEERRQRANGTANKKGAWVRGLLDFVEKHKVDIGHCDNECDVVVEMERRFVRSRRRRGDDDEEMD